ncbi:hypothetical protein G9U51_09235 [Calidifontibacter sp. DB0510]|uniref:Probable 2-phosphosulfolactate phosphatase n=1 Tax=Metallococcus carri TaxID=1656884 RepID=A0A967B0S2_9MICO|nr:2-phosphosulfolactate phosphatase [Metallococcus carri]NHN55957.1 hypothetical protein [Metallococcus carri]NOP37586.1 hypothetical protein [Calidifontibacter sp. DB2511S]
MTAAVCGALPAHQQRSWPVRAVWGGIGARYLLGDIGDDRPVLAVVVDVLSFSTCVTIAADRGASVYPYRWRDQGAARLAERVGAQLARPRPIPAPARHTELSLSPAALSGTTPYDALVLPSPNGSTISTMLRSSGASVVAGCLRNARTVGEYAAAHVASGGAVLLVQAGEHWPDGSLRPSAEDLWGAGAILAHLSEADRSPEAELSVDAWRAVKRTVVPHLKSCSSGQELIEKGYLDDVLISGALNASDALPVLQDDGAYRDLRRTVAPAS